MTAEYQRGVLCPSASNAVALVLILCFGYSETQQTLYGMNNLRNLAITTDTTFKLDISISIPIMIGNVSVMIDMDLDLEVAFMNHSIQYMPIKIPYLIMPEAKPIVVDLTNKYHHNYYGQNAYDDSMYSYDSYYGTDQVSPYFESSSMGGNRRYSSGSRARRKDDLPKKKSKSKQMYGQAIGRTRKGPSNRASYYNQQRRRALTEQLSQHYGRHKRSLAAASAQHRADLLNVLATILDRYGLDGQACLCRAICELVEMDFLIESPLHEVLEHLLR